MNEQRQFCTFRLDQHLFGIDVLDVQEILRQHSVTRVPLAPPVIHGLINLRGQIVAIIDLRVRLGLPPRTSKRPPIHVVARTARGAISLLVDEVGDMMSFPFQANEAPPETLRGTVRDLMCGVFQLKDQLLLVLDTGKIIDLTTRSVSA
jgi:purine-binding chemotaxis protein CheW